MKKKNSCSSDDPFAWQKNWCWLTETQMCPSCWCQIMLSCAKPLFETDTKSSPKGVCHKGRSVYVLIKWKYARGNLQNCWVLIKIALLSFELLSFSMFNWALNFSCLTSKYPDSACTLYCFRFSYLLAVRKSHVS